MLVVTGNDVVMENLIVVAKIVAMTGLQDFTVYGEECKFGGTYWKEGVGGTREAWSKVLLSGLWCVAFRAGGFVPAGAC